MPAEQKRLSSSESTARIVRLKRSKTANWQQRSSIRSALQKASCTLTKSQTANKFPSASSCSPLAWTLQMWISILARDSRIIQSLRDKDSRNQDGLPVDLRLGNLSIKPGPFRQRRGF